MIKAYLVDEVTLVTKTYDLHGEPSESYTELKAKVNWGTKWIKDKKGEMVLAQGHVLIEDREMNYLDNLIIGSVYYKIVAMIRPKAWNVRGHVEVWIDDSASSPSGK